MATFPMQNHNFLCCQPLLFQVKKLQKAIKNQCQYTSRFDDFKNIENSSPRPPLEASREVQNRSKIDPGEILRGLGLFHAHGSDLEPILNQILSKFCRFWEPFFKEIRDF